MRLKATGQRIKELWYFVRAGTSWSVIYNLETRQFDIIRTSGIAMTAKEAKE